MGQVIFFLYMLGTKQTLLPGVSLNASVVILPYHKYIATMEPRQPELIIWNFGGKIVKKIHFADSLVNVSETTDKIYVTLYSKDKKFYAVALSTQLNTSEKTEFKSVYSPAIIHGQWFSMDIFDIIENNHKHPKLFTSLDKSSDAYFKVPQEMRDAKFQSKYAWIFPWENGLVGLVMGSPMLYLLDSNYLAREKLESDRVETEKIKKIPLKIEGLDKESFTQKGLMRKDEYVASMKKFYREKVLIRAAWTSRYGLTIACGNFESSVIVHLNQLYDTKTIKMVSGRLLNGHGDVYWVMQHLNGSIAIETGHLP